MSQYPAGPETPSQNNKTSGLAITAMVLGIIGLCFLPLGLVALILGIVALAKTGTPGADKGRPFAIVGTVLGGMSILVAPLLIAILLPALGAARRTAQRMQNSTQLRGIHQGLVSFSSSNKNLYPGLSSNGDILADGPATGSSGDGDAPQARMWILLDGDFFTPEYAISPSESGNITAYPGSGAVTKDHYSYAMLQYKKTGSVIQPQSAVGDPVYRIDPATTARAAEWKATVTARPSCSRTATPARTPPTRSTASTPTSPAVGAARCSGTTTTWASRTPTCSRPSTPTAR